MADNSGEFNEVKAAEESGEQSDISSRRSFLSKSMKRAAYIAPIIWTISARQARATTSIEAGSMEGTDPDSPVGDDPPEFVGTGA